MQGVTLDVILRTVFGLDEGPAKRELRAALIDLLEPWARTRSCSWPLQQSNGNRRERRPRASWPRARAWTACSSARSRPGGWPTSPAARDILSLLVQATYEDGRPLDDQALRDELMTILLAGHETTATALAWAVSHVLAHPDVRRRLPTSCAALGPGAARSAARDPPRVPRRRLPRDAPPDAHRPARRPPPDPADAHRAASTCPPAWSRLRASTWRIAASERWPEPERFRPERFLESKPTPYEFLPFGGGVRRCLGMAFALVEMKIVLAEVLTRVELRAAPGYQVRVVRRSVTLAPSEGMPVVVERRAAA